MRIKETQPKPTWLAQIHSLFCIATAVKYICIYMCIYALIYSFFSPCLVMGEQRLTLYTLSFV